MFAFQWIKYSNVLDVFLVERGHQLRLYAIGNWWRMEEGRGHPKWVQLGTGSGGAKPHVYVRTYTLSFHVLAAFLSYSVLFYL